MDISADATAGPEDATPEKGKKRRRKDFLLLFLFLVTIAFLVRVIFDYAEKKRLLEDRLRDEEALSQAYYQLDVIEKDLESKIVQITELGGRVGELLDAKEELLQQKESIRRRGEGVIQGLQEKVAGYTELLLEKDQELENLKRANKILLSENVDLKKEANKLHLSLRELHDKQKALEDKIYQVSALKMGDVEVVGLRKNGKPLRGLRSARVRALRVSFDVLKNELTPMGRKAIYLRIIAPNKEVLFDVESGGGSFSLDGKEVFYTLKQEILYRREDMAVSFDYAKKTKFMPGSYMVEGYAEGSLLGRVSFEMRR